MNDRPLTPAQVLLIKAAEDEAVLQLDGVSEAIVGFHAQQAVEKLIKALLSELKVPFEFTHDLGRLQKILTAAGETLPATPLPLGDLNDFSVFYRYDLLFQFAVPERDDLLATIRLIREHVVARITAVSSPSATPPVQ